jgi:hypothetical protein
MTKFEVRRKPGSGILPLGGCNASAFLAPGVIPELIRISPFDLRTFISLRTTVHETLFA